MKNCPICGTKMYQNVFHGIRNIRVCPIHSYFTEEEENASKEYYDFKYDIHRVDALSGLAVGMKDDKGKIIRIYSEKGYSNAIDLLGEKIDGYFDWIRIAQISTLKIAVDRYSIRKKYKHSGDLCTKNEAIINKHLIQIKKDSKYIPSMDVLKEIRDYVVHPDNRKTTTIMSNLIENVPDAADSLSFLYEPLISVELEGEKSIFFNRGVLKADISDFLSNNVRNRSYTKFRTFLEFLLEEIQEVILDIDKNGKGFKS